MADSRSSRNTLGATPGPAVDSLGNPAVDPTANVLQLVEAAIKRQDDLRRSEGEHLRELIGLRAEERERDVALIREAMAQQAKHDENLRTAEAQRIDSIRSVDVQAVQQAAQVQATQATTLAAQVATSAETLRTQVAAAASAATIALAAALEPVQKDIADLRRAQYEAQGQKTQVVETRGASAQTMNILGVILAAMIVAVALYAAFHK